MEGGYGYEVPPRTGELLVDGYYYKPSNFSSRICYLRVHLNSHRHPYIHIHTGSVEGTQWVKKQL